MGKNKLPMKFVLEIKLPKEQEKSLNIISYFSGLPVEILRNKIKSGVLLTNSYPYELASIFCSKLEENHIHCDIKEEVLTDD